MSRHTGLVVNGVIPDGRNVVYRGRKEHGDYKDMFGIEIGGKVLAERIGAYFHYYTCGYGGRPLGTSCLQSAWDASKGYSLHLMEPSGACT